jgi:hypothetical protein
MVLADADLVLVAAFSNVLELFAEDKVARGSLVLQGLHLHGRPIVQRGRDIDGRLHARLREGDGGVAGHGVVSGGVGQRQGCGEWSGQSGVIQDGSRAR